MILSFIPALSAFAHNDRPDLFLWSEAGLLTDLPSAFHSLRTISRISDCEFIVELQIRHSGYRGFAKVDETLPLGFEAFECMSSKGIFSFTEGSVKVLWMQLPKDGKLLVRYRIKATQVKTGEYSIEGKYSYEKNARLEVGATGKNNFRYNMPLKKQETADPTKQKEWMYQDLMAEGDALIISGKFETALRVFQEAASLKPGESTPEAKIVFIRKKQKEHRLSQTAEETTRLRENEYHLLIHEAGHFFKKADYANAYKLFKHALRVKPDGVEAKTHLEKIERQQMATDPKRR